MTETRTPGEINGYPVIAMVKVPDRDGTRPGKHVVVVKVASIARPATYTVWTTAWQQVGETPTAGHWETGNGRHDISELERALLIMCARASDLGNW